MLINTPNLIKLRAGFKTNFQNAFDTSESTHEKVATVVVSSSGEENYGWLKKTTVFREWIGPRVVQNLSESEYVIKNKSFENTVGVDRDHIEDDNLGIYSMPIAQLGEDAKMHPDELVWAMMQSGFDTKCFDGQYFFDTDHPVGSEAAGYTTYSNYTDGAGPGWYLLDITKKVKPLIFQKRRDYQFVAKDDPTDSNVFGNKEFLYGVDCRVNAGFGLPQLIHASKAELNQANFDAAYDAMASLKGDNGKPLRIRPTLLVVPPQLRTKANEVVKVERQANGATNPNQNLVEIHMEQMLA